MSRETLKKEREEAVDSILVFMNEEIERHGALIGQIEFSFEESGEDAVAIIEETGYKYELICEALNICITRSYVEHRCLGGGKYRGLILTEEGQGRAISVEAAKHTHPVTGSNIQIGALHSYGNTQVGDGNIQNVELVFSSIIESINKADSSDEEKDHAKRLLAKFLEHPLVQTAIGSATTIIAAKMGGV